MTYPQMKAYRQLVARAATELGIDPRDDFARREYRLRALREETGKNSSTAVNSTDEYEAIMRRHAVDAADYALAASFCGVDERRYAALVDDCARQIAELSGRPSLDRLAYLRAILRQAGLAERSVAGDAWWMDYPDATPKMLFCILDRHRRRMVARLAGHAARRLPRAFRFGYSWTDDVKAAATDPAPRRVCRRDGRTVESRGRVPCGSCAALPAPPRLAPRDEFPRRLPSPKAR